MLVGGVWIDDRLVRRLAAVLNRPLDRKLEQALLFRAQVVALTREEKASVLAALERGGAELEEVRELFLRHDDWREGHGRFGEP